MFDWDSLFNWLQSANLLISLLVLAIGAFLINLINFRSPDIEYVSRPKTWDDFVNCYFLCLIFVPLFIFPARLNKRRLAITIIAIIASLTIAILLLTSRYPLLVGGWLIIVLIETRKSWQLRDKK